MLDYQISYLSEARHHHHHHLRLTELLLFLDRALKAECWTPNFGEALLGLWTLALEVEEDEKGNDRTHDVSYTCS